MYVCHTMIFFVLKMYMNILKIICLYSIYVSFSCHRQAKLTVIFGFHIMTFGPDGLYLKNRVHSAADFHIYESKSLCTFKAIYLHSSSI